MKVNLIKKYTYGLGISILLILIDNVLIKDSLEKIFNNKFINLSTLFIYFFDPIINLFTLLGIILTFYFITKIYIIILGKEK